MYADAQSVRRRAARGLLPPKRITVSQAANRYMKINATGGYIGPWDPSLVPYMIEPMDSLSRRDVECVVMVAPARTGKTCALLEGWLSYIVTTAPGNTMHIHTTRDMARAYSHETLQSMLDNCPDIRDKLSARANEDNTHDKYFRNGMSLTIGWPSETQLASRTLKNVGITDLDRLEIDPSKITGIFDKARKRTQTYLSAGMTMVESSPGHDVMDIDWSPKSEHEAPPCFGILELYNRGDRRCAYWTCPACNEIFQPRFNRMVFDEDPERDPYQVSQEATMGCPHCGTCIGPERKYKLNQGMRWLTEAEVTGNDRKSRIRSYWAFGPMAAYQPWSSLVYNFLLAKASFARTGNEDPLRQTIYQDQGEPYMPQSIKGGRQPWQFERQAVELPKRLIPEDVRYLTCAVDVQARAFVVQVEGWSPEKRYIIDRYNLRWSKRPGPDGDHDLVNPGAYLEDWEILIERCMQKAYPLATDEALSMPVLYTFCDSGGQSGVTARAYDFWRLLMKRGLTGKFGLVKGDGNQRAPRIKESYPDTSQTARRARARGEVPINLLNVNVLKDELNAQLEAQVCVFPNWLPKSFYHELASEMRDEITGKWAKKQHKSSNEALDLMVYNRAATIKLGADQLNWANPPKWALPQRDNPYIIGGDPTAPAQAKGDKKPKRKGRIGSWAEKFYD